MTNSPDKFFIQRRSREDWKSSVAQQLEQRGGLESKHDMEDADELLRNAEICINEIRNLEEELISEIQKGQGPDTKTYQALRQRYDDTRHELRNSIFKLGILKDTFAENKDKVATGFVAKITTFINRPFKKGSEQFDNLPERFYGETPAEILKAEGWEYFNDARNISDNEAKAMALNDKELADARRSGDRNSEAPVYIKDYDGDDAPPTAKLRQYSK